MGVLLLVNLLHSVADILLSKFGRYRRLHAIRFTLSNLGSSLNVLLTENTHAGVWAILQIIDALGRSIILPTTLPAILASLAEEDVATATGVQCMRSFGYIRGITIPGITFNNRFDANCLRVLDPIVRNTLLGGRAYELATGGFIILLSASVKKEVVELYIDALKVVWLVAMGFGVTSFVAVVMEKGVPLRTELDNQYGPEFQEKSTDAERRASKSGVNTWSPENFANNLSYKTKK
ncbi:hypothetical protein BS50DRAFT_581978 [Corynespora cassiicola Philippines]|uniref:Uncharacterized protein n=1 Tax=Corynespora cassiicola Philippines TaxID=1448308 RepID=A0A2T2PC92_CORCC|nr:hypothetical protein BS50DRAFT_581978 [Corynespora cassiicola Philippines]